MALSSELVSQFVKATNDTETKKKETTVNGTIVEYNGSKYMKIDGSELLTPISTTVAVSDGERVSATIKDHTLTVNGNVSSPAAKNSDVEAVGTKITELDVVVANKVSTDELETEKARIKNLEADNVTIKDTLYAENGEFQTLKAEQAEFEELTADNFEAVTGKFETLESDFGTFKDLTAENFEATNATIHNLEADYGEFEELTTKNFEAVNGSIKNLDTEKLSAEDAKFIYANIDFANIGEAAIKKIFADTGLIKDIIVGDGTVTGELVGVTIKGDLIEGGTVVADKLVIKGEDGLYYKLNTDGETIESEQTEYNSLDGKHIIAKSITATKISVKDLVAFDATIGGFKITENSIYSGVKESADNTTTGIYMDNEGQLVLGDASNFLKYYKDQNGNYKLEVSAESISFGAGSKKSVSDAINDSIEGLEIGGRNLLVNSSQYQKDTAYYLTPTSNDHYVYLDTTMCAALTAGEEYTLQCTTDGLWGAHDTDGSTIDRNCTIWLTNASNSFHECYGGDGTKSGMMSWTFTAAHTDDYCIRVNTYVAGSSTVGFWNFKIEKGNKATDWTPAPKDVDESIADTQDDVDATKERVTTAESAILDIKENIIKMLVTDGNGTSLMSQTADGWTFSTSDIQDAVNKTSDNLKSLIDDLGSTDAVVETLQEAVSNLEETAEYVRIGSYQDEPCIELGESDSDFKLKITNTRIMFLQGDDPEALTYIDNRGLITKNIEVENELRQGGFAWVIHGNGNLGLIWKGVG